MKTNEYRRLVERVAISYGVMDISEDIHYLRVGLADCKVYFFEHDVEPYISMGGEGLMIYSNISHDEAMNIMKYNGFNWKNIKAKMHLRPQTLTQRIALGKILVHGGFDVLVEGNRVTATIDDMEFVFSNEDDITVNGRIMNSSEYNLLSGIASIFG